MGASTLRNRGTPNLPGGPRVSTPGAAETSELIGPDPTVSFGVPVNPRFDTSTTKRRSDMILNEDSIQDWIAARSGWTVQDGQLTKTFAFPAFRDSIVFVNRVATLADQADHHPDIDVRYDQVQIGLATHSEGGITDKDTALAEQIDFATSNR